MKNSSIELDIQKELEGYFAFLEEDILSDESLEEDIDWEDYFSTTVSVVSINNSSKESDDIDTIEINNLPNQKKPFHQKKALGNLLSEHGVVPVLPLMQNTSSYTFSKARP